VHGYLEDSLPIVKRQPSAGTARISAEPLGIAVLKLTNKSDFPISISALALVSVCFLQQPTAASVEGLADRGSVGSEAGFVDPSQILRFPPFLSLIRHSISGRWYFV
jgi:hypothetical protein